MTKTERDLYKALRECHTYLGQLIEDCPEESNGIAQFIDEHVWPFIHGNDELNADWLFEQAKLSPDHVVIDFGTARAFYRKDLTGMERAVRAAVGADEDSDGIPF